ncbi:hypothetical protein [Virgibacillus doumboii]|uniref:hypothetical protein n=1 Tax=Virgibacillus doumboii TaxID=2697503 RepID=UPI0013DEB934|nr:hypothetical protein [Virgibacillus doumboii]
MKYFINIIALLILFIPITITAAEEKNNAPSPQQISKNTDDVTGDSQKETIVLKGILFSRDTDYFMDTWATVTSTNDRKWKIPYEGGYDPKLQFIDLNHDNVKDIFYQSATGGSGGLYYYKLHTLKNKQLKEIKLAEQYYVKAEFKDNYKVEVQLSPEKEPNIVDVEDQASEYIQLGIYNKQGKLLKKTSAMIDPIAYYEPVLISERKGYGLKSYQQISGAYHADQLGTVETLWYYEKDKWIILKTKWVPSK